MKKEKITLPKIMRAKYRNRLRKLAEGLAFIPDERFNLESWMTEAAAQMKCGTVCCVGGWCPKFFPKEWR